MRIFTLPKQRRTPTGFTLIELLVVTTLVIFLLMSVSSMFMTILVGNAQTNIRRQLKAEGTAMISQLEFLFRSAKNVKYTNGTALPCTGGNFQLASTPIVIEDGENNQFTISYEDNKIKVQNGSNAKADLNSSFVIPQSPNITCYGSSTTQKKSVKIDFTLQWQQDTTNFSDTYTTTVQLRNT